MRVLTIVVALLALPTLVAAQQPGELADDPADDPATPTIQVEQITPTLGDEISPDAPDVDDVNVDRQNLTAEEAAMLQDPTDRQWWWLVGAIVLGGIIIAVLL